VRGRSIQEEIPRIGKAGEERDFNLQTYTKKKLITQKEKKKEEDLGRKKWKGIEQY